MPAGYDGSGTGAAPRPPTALRRARPGAQVRSRRHLPSGYIFVPTATDDCPRRRWSSPSFGGWMTAWP